MIIIALLTLCAVCIVAVAIVLRTEPETFSSETHRAIAENQMISAKLKHAIETYLAHTPPRG